MSGPHLVVIGGSCLDCIVTTAELPAWGDDLRVDALRTRPGGKGLNQAVALARLGATVSAVGVIGDDAVGRDLLEALEAEGVGTATMTVRSGTATPVCVVLAHPDGRTAFLCRWADELELTETDLAVARDAVRAARAVLVTFDPPAATVSAAIGLAASAGVPVVVNPAPPPPGPAMLDHVAWSRVAVATPNETEARLLLRAAGDPAGDGAAEDLAEAFGRRFGPGLTCVTRSEHGVVSWDGRTRRSHPAHPADVVDTTAASDAFTAALALRLLARPAAPAAVPTLTGTTPAEATVAAVEAGLAAAAWTVGRPGAFDALPHTRDLGSDRFGPPWPATGADVRKKSLEKE